MNLANSFFLLFTGDHREQVYRLLTFKEFPNNNVDPYLLAKNGFCYTGYKDRAKCHRYVTSFE